MLRSPVVGRTDAAVAMLQNFLIPMKDGWPLKLITPIHGGCIRILGSRAAGVTSVADLRGKAFGIPAGPVQSLATMVFKLILMENGLDPSEVTLVPVERENFLPVYAEGRIQGSASIDPPAGMMMRRNLDLVEIASNMSGPMEGRSCCVVAAGPRLWRDEPIVGVALAGALSQAADWTMANPDEAAGLVAKATPFPEKDVALTLREMNYQVHKMPKLRDDVEMFARNLKTLGAFPPDLDPKAFAAKTVAQVIC